MEGIQCQTFTIKREQTDVKIKDLGEWDVKELIIKKFYDLDGREIPEGQNTRKNVHVKLQEKTYKEFGEKWKEYLLFVNGKKVQEEVVSIKGNTNRLLIKACTGAG